MEEAPPLVRQHHEDIENSKGDGTTKKSVETNCFAWLFRKVRHVWEGGFPDEPCIWPRWPGILRYRSGELRFRCRTASELEQFPMNPRCSPHRICQTHLADQLPNFPIDRGPSRFALPTLPSPVPTEPSSMPGDHRFGLYDKQRRAPLRPEAGEPRAVGPRSSDEAGRAATSSGPLAGGGELESQPAGLREIETTIGC